MSVKNGHIIFDCDGTLISSHEAVLKALAKVFSEHHERAITIEDVRGKFSPNVHELYANFGIEEGPVSDQLQKRWSEITMGPGYDYALYEEIEELLHRLSEYQTTLYVWTARDRQSTRKILGDLGVLDYFKDIRCGDDQAGLKPNPGGLIEMLEGVNRADAMVIGDSFTDIYGANNFGCASIAALWGEHSSKETLMGVGASYAAEHPLACLPLIENHL